MMTNTQKELLQALRCFMQGDEEYHLPERFSQLKELCDLAAMHKILAIIYEMIRRDSVLLLEENAPLAARWKKSAIAEVMLQVQRTAGFLELYQKLQKEGVHPLVVKGLICRSFYEKPDFRISADEDLLLRKEEFETFDCILLEEGYKRQELDPKDLPYEIPYLNPRNQVYIELHFSLFAEGEGAYGHLNQEFAGAFDRCICEQIEGVDIKTLSPTDHMFYLICHSFKHFLHSGFGIRQVCDMVMMAKHYTTRIDWREIQDKLAQLRMDTFFSALAKIGRVYLGCSWEKTGYVDDTQECVDCMPLLVDLLEGGVYGGSTMERRHSANMTLEAARRGKKATASSVLSSLFPGVSYMKGHYVWLCKYPWLLPAAWVMRLFGYAADRKHTEDQSSLEIGKKRVELLRKYHVID